MEGRDRSIDDLVALFDHARVRPDLSAFAQSAAAEFLASEAALARANAAEALAFRMVEKAQFQSDCVNSGFLARRSFSFVLNE